MNIRRQSKTIFLSCSAALAIAAAIQGAYAADLPSNAVAPAAPVPSFALFDGVEYHAQFEGGIMGNSANPGDSENIGHLYTDRANEPQINQALLTITKAVDPKATGYAFGFTGQALFGSDERFNHFIGFADSNITGREQFGVVQAFLAAHLPWMFAGGVDVKAGLFTSPQGVETLDPSTSPFYSHSYIYNYGVTFNHTGIITTTHVNSTLDIWLGVDTGNQTTFGAGDPNGEPAGFVGFGLNGLLDGKLTVLALSHIGPEQSPLVDPLGYKSDLRFYNDADFTYKINDDWTWTTELDYIHDDFGLAGGGASGYGATEYLGYAVTKTLTLNLRGEVFRDAQGAFVFNYPGNLDAVNAVKGLPNTSFNAGPTTYSEFTLGLTYKPDVPKPLALLSIRPEVRYDRALSGNTPYDATAGNIGRTKDQFTFGADVILGF
ncbi:MAG: outer membrane beta-barrel protein [Beijerinckiaceae bacterium]